MVTTQAESLIQGAMDAAGLLGAVTGVLKMGGTVEHESKYYADIAHAAAGRLREYIAGLEDDITELTRPVAFQEMTPLEAEAISLWLNAQAKPPSGWIRGEGINHGLATETARFGTASSPSEGGEVDGEADHQGRHLPPRRRGGGQG